MRTGIITVMVAAELILTDILNYRSFSDCTYHNTVNKNMSVKYRTGQNYKRKQVILRYIL